MYASSLANGLRLLASFSMEAPALSNGELAMRSGLSPASVTRLTYTLGELGYLRYDAAERRYRLGAATMTVGYPLLASLGVRQVAGPLMQALARAVRATVSLALRERTHMVYVETYRGHDAIAFRPEVGGRIPIWATATGRAWLAGADPALARSAVAQIRREHAADWACHRSAVTAAREAYERTGFCVAHGQWQPDIRAIAVPMQRQIAGETLVFNCGVPMRQLGAAELESEVGPRLIELVRTVERAYSSETAD